MAFPRQTQVLLALGYSLVTIRNNPSLFPSVVSDDPNSMIYCADIMTRLATLDEELANNIRDSMAVKVQDLGLDYGAYISHANRSGSKLLQELATAISTPVMFDKYMGGGSPVSIRSYY